MTDSPTPPPDDTEPLDPEVSLASAHVDGELDDEEQARLAADPAAAELAVRMSAIAHQVRDVPPPPQDLADAHVAAALSAMDDSTSDTGTVVPMERRRPDRSWWQRLPLGAVAAVVAVVALIGAVGLASMSGDDDTDTAATALDQADEGAEDGADDTAEADEDLGTFDAAPDSEADGSASTGLALGRPSFATYDELAEALAAVPATTAGGEVTDDAETTTSQDAAVEERAAEEPDDPCGAVTLLGLDPADVEQQLSAVVDGEPVTAVVHQVDGERQLSVVDDATCTVAVERAL